MRRVTALLLTLLFLSACGGTSAPEAAQLATLPPLSATSLPTAPATVAPTEATTAPPSATPEPPTVIPTPQPTEAPTVTLEPTTPPTPTSEPTPEALTYVFPVDAETCTPSSTHHDYPASDIACPMGTEFVAVTSGVVEFVSREDKYAQGSRDPVDFSGLAVAIIGDDGVRYYGSHLSAVTEGIETGVRVEAGQLLGLTGESGNAAGTHPHVHFGISHPTTPEDWQTRRGEVWPQEYLKAWKHGENVTPKLP